MAKVTRECDSCGEPYTAKTADLKRGWGKHCSKSCAAKTTNKKTGNHARFHEMKAKAEELDAVEWEPIQ